MFTPSWMINENQVNIRTIEWRFISAPRSWLHKKYSCFDFLAHSVFTFDVFWSSLGPSIVENSSKQCKQFSCKQCSIQTTFQTIFLFFKVKSKIFFIIFKMLSVAKNSLRPKRMSLNQHIQRISESLSNI